MRPAGVEDLDAIDALERRLFPEDAWARETIAAELEGPHGYYLVAEERPAGDGIAAVLGYAGLLAPRGSGQGDVQTLAVVPEARGRGLGRALLRALLAEAAERGADQVFLEVRADNDVAQSLYTAEGFTAIGRRPRYYRGGVDAIVMARSAPASTPAGGVGA
ncbi:MAG: ribosomal protein S18-alanine N-acetyltransferase [Actinomycetales bacterium]|nr:ribosomal protein S18-alanine N-acetyltransferase [Actinomycetales bacterium]